MPRVAVAASGGADSTALIVEAAARFRPDQVTVLSVDHRTRASAVAERAHAAAVAARFGFAFNELTIDAVPPNQAAWRKARLDVLLRFCETHCIPRLWLGHHQGDSVETAAIRLLAGGSLRALAGISAERIERGIIIERPLLGRTAREIRRGLVTEGLTWCEDPSNRNAKYRRVAVRGLLGSSAGLDRADLVRRTGQWRSKQDQLQERAWGLAASRGLMDSLWLNPAVLRALPDGLAATILHRAALTVAGREQRLRNVVFEEAVADSLSEASLGGARAWMMDEQWLMGRDYRHIQSRVPLQPGVLTCWDARYKLRLRADLGCNGLWVGRLGLREARKRGSDLPAEWLAASLAIWSDKTLVAAPDIGVWKGGLGAELRDMLEWHRLPALESSVFRVAP